VAAKTASIELFERVVMEIDLTRRIQERELPPGLRIVDWRPDLLEDHAVVLAKSFVGNDDVRLFRRLGSIEGCRGIMRDITGHANFDPAASLLIEDQWGVIGCVQGIRQDGRIGVVQNVAVVPERRGEGVGFALLSACCRGFKSGGLRYALLEVTAGNEAALGLYQSMGFFPRRRYLRTAEMRKDE
jgi:ribosomal protein S18 acetylase RimI-like enzyme